MNHRIHRAVAPLVVTAIVCSALVLGVADPASAATGSISGTVAGVSPASGISVHVIGPATSTLERRVATDASGQYTVSGLALSNGNPGSGQYKVLVAGDPAVTERGFRWYQSGVAGADAPTSASTVTLTTAASNATGIHVTLDVDADKDGWSDVADPDDNNADMDNDLLRDGDEVHRTLTVPTDPDSSVWNNGGLDGDKDSDGDLITNSQEMDPATWTERTSPRALDTDGDGLTDYDEIVRIGIDAADPNDVDTDDLGPFDGEDDPDGDGLVNREELVARLDPRDIDSNGDLLPDNLEDPDHDGVTNEDEWDTWEWVFYGLKAYANSLDPDTDNDGDYDGAEPGADSLNPRTIDEAIDGPLGFHPTVPPIVAPNIIPGSGTWTIDAYNHLGINEATTRSLALQVHVEAPLQTAWLRVLPAGQSPNPTVGSVRFNAAEDQTASVNVALGTNGSITIQNGSTIPVNVTMTVVGRWGTQTCPDPCTENTPQVHHRFQPAVATTVWDGQVTAGSTVPIDPAAGVAAAHQASVDWGVYAVTWVPPAGATNKAFAMAMADPADGVPDPNDSIASNETASGQRIITVRVSGAPKVSQLRHTSGTGQPHVRIALIGYYVAGTYYEASKGTAAAITVADDATVSVDARGIDGMPARLPPTNGTGLSAGPSLSMAMLNVTATSSVSGDVLFGGTSQVSVVANKASTNTVFVPIDYITNPGRYAVSFQSDGVGGSVDLAVDVLGWFEYDHYIRDDPAPQATGSRFVALAAPVRDYRSWVGTGPVNRQMLGRNGVPATGVSQVMVSVQALSYAGVPTVNTGVSVWGRNRKMPDVPQLTMVPNRTDSVTLIVDVGTTGEISMGTSASTVVAELTVLGYFTPYTADDTANVVEGTPSVAIVGDSITAGASGVFLQYFRDTARINTMGIAGYETRDMRWWGHQLGMSRPEYAIVFLGTNDGLLPFVGGYSSGFTAVDELQKYATQHFPNSCVIFPAYLFGGVEAVSAGEGFIDFTRYLAEWEQDVQARQPDLDDDYPAFYKDGYPVQSGDNIHLSETGDQALALLYQQAITGATPSRGASPFSTVIEPPTQMDFGAYTSGCAG